MKSKKILSKLEHDLTHFLISELCKKDPSKRNSSELYRYKGLNIHTDSNENKKINKEKTFFVRIGVMEAEFKLGTCEKCSGGLSAEEEKLIKQWMNTNNNEGKLQMAFEDEKLKKRPEIIPFDLEYYYS